MAITYTFTIEKLEGAPSLNEQTNVVTGVYFRITGVDGSIEKQAVGYIPVEYDADNFIAFSNLTEATVKGWVEADTTNFNAYKSLIADEIQELKVPTKTELTKPW